MNYLKLKYHLSILLALFLISLSCQKKNDTKGDNLRDNIVVTGKIENIIDTTINFSYYEYSFLKDLTTYPVMFDATGNFKMELNTDNPLKGWFSFGRVPVQEVFTYTTKEGRDTVMRTGTFDSKMAYLYLKPGDSIHMTANADDIDNTLAFEGTSDDDILFAIKEDKMFNDYKHKYLKNWYDVSQRDPENYKQTVEKLYDEKTRFLNDFKASHNLSPSLISFYESINYSTLISSKVNYPNINASYNNNKQPELPSNYYDFLNKVNLQNSIGENGIGYYYNLRAYLKKKYELAFENNPNQPEFYEWLKRELPEKVRYEFMAYSLSSDFSNRIYSEFDSSSPYPEMAKIVKEKYKHLEGMLEGSEAPDVSFENTKGEIINLSDYRGKYTYIDLWATWCGPCIKEIPSLQKIEKAYHGKNIQFVSVSFDKEKDHDKWISFVKEKSLKGNQLIAKKETHDILSETYNIKMIPRFIFLDPEGKIIDATAPFPSDPMLLKLFDKYNL